MSGKVASLVQERVIPDHNAKMILIACALRGDDSGVGIWASKATFALEMVMSRAATMRAFRWLEDHGFLVRVGTRPCAEGHTIEYRIDLLAVVELPKVADQERPPKRARKAKGSPTETCGVSVRDPRGLPETPHGSLPETQTVLEPSLNQEEQQERVREEGVVDPPKVVPIRPEPDDLRLLDMVMEAAGVREYTSYWMPHTAAPHVGAWRRTYGLTATQIADVIRTHRQASKKDPPTGPKAFDRIIAQHVAALNAPPPPFLDAPAPAAERRKRHGNDYSLARAVAARIDEAHGLMAGEAAPSYSPPLLRKGP